MRLDGKAAIVTGAASGIGRATAALFADQGASVLAVDLPDTGLGEADGDGDRIATLEIDIAPPAAAEAIVAAALQRFGRLDILMNNAGIGTKQGVSSPGDGVLDAVNYWNYTVMSNTPCRRQGWELHWGNIWGNVSACFAADAGGAIRARQPSLRSSRRADHVAGSD